MTENIQYNTDPKHAERYFSLEEKKLDAGIMGRFFGSTTWAAASIAWTTIFLLTISGISIIFITCSIQPADYWKIISPIITLALGYLFGKSGK